MSPKEYEAELRELETRLDRLRSLYEQYFRGFEKQQPLILRKDVEGRMRHLSKVRMKNTALRFKLQVQLQRYSTLLAYWQRMMRALEEGELRRGALVEGTQGSTIPPKEGAAEGGKGEGEEIEVSLADLES